MLERTFAEEAAACRVWADELAGTQEQAILLRLADEFISLENRRTGTSTPVSEDTRYFAARAAQESEAANRAGHPKARSAHLTLADRYIYLAGTSGWHDSRKDFSQA